MKLEITLLAILLAASLAVTAAPVDDLRIDVSHDPCEGGGANDKNFVVYASNLNSTRAIDANFKYDSVPAQQRFILFDADLNPVTDRFPKFHSRRLGPRKTVRIGCTNTYRAAPVPPGPLMVPIVIAKQGATYVEPNSPEEPPEDARSFAAFYLQGGVNECASGAKPPGVLFLVNLHPYARLSTSMNLLDGRGARVGSLTPNLAPSSAARIGCSNGFSRPGAVTNASLDVTAALDAPAEVAAPLPAAAAPQASPSLPGRSEPQPVEPSLAPLSLGAILRTQNVCAGSAPPGWIKINDAWNPTVCGKPGTISYNVWTIEQLSDQPIGAVVHACRGSVPSGWAIVGTGWNPTVCGHPSTNQPNVMAIKRLN